MAPRKVPYVLVPSPERPVPSSSSSFEGGIRPTTSRRIPEVVITSPRKRKPSRSLSPFDSSSSSRSTSPNVSPKKKTRTEEDIDYSLAKVSLRDRPASPTVSDSYRPAEEEEEEDAFRPLSPTVSELFGFVEGEGDAELSSQVDSTVPVVFQFQEDILYTKEDEVGEALGETGGVGKPIRLLRDFSIFEREDFHLISATELLAEDISHGLYGASGIVSCVQASDGVSESEGSTSGDDEPSLWVKSLEIIGFNVHAFDESLDENVYLETKHAWYILDSVSELYEPFWAPFRIRHRLGHLVLAAACGHPRITYGEFVGSLDSPELTEDVFKSDEIVAYLIQAVDRVLQSDAPISRVPLIRTFADQPLPELPPRTRAAKTRKAVAVDKDSETFVTPVIGRVVMKYLNSPVSIVGTPMREAEGKLAEELNEVREHLDDPAKIRWGKKSVHPGFYCSVLVDGVKYKTNDVVAVARGIDDNSERAKGEREAAAHCGNAYAKQVWFLRIGYFFDHPEEDDQGKPRKMCHGEWFTHGSRTVLQQVTHTQELFLLSECSDVPVASFYQKCPVRFLELGEVEEPDRFDAQARDYFCQLMYDETTHDFTDLPTPEECSRLNEKLPAHKPCTSCGRNAQEELFNTVRGVLNGVTQYGRTYHIADFVYVKPVGDHKHNYRLHIAKILAINWDIEHGCYMLDVRYYRRYAEDSRRIYRTVHKNAVEVDDLDGPCFVRHLDPEEPADQEEIETWVDAHPDHFHTNKKEKKNGEMSVMMSVKEEEFGYCIDCFNQHCDELEDGKRLVHRNGRIPVLEVFSGAGGLSQGLDQSGFFTTEWAVERSFPAAETFRLNHPETKVLCADINALLRYCADTNPDKEPLRSSDANRTPIPDDQIPRRGEAGLICGGPPCQSFSGANSNKVENDPRSMLPFTMLSMAEVFEPNYFMLENVTGLLQHSVVNKESDDGDRINKATLKLIIRGLIALGYQVRFKILQAGQYGVPQGRQRLIIFGAMRGCELPQGSVPTHAYPKAAHAYLLHNNSPIPPVKRGRGPEDNHIFAPHACVTIGDAIGDLPPFDWRNPHKIIPETQADVIERENRAAQGIRQFDPFEAPVGFSDPVKYATKPTTRYQKAMRRNNPTTVQYHFTSSGSPFLAEAAATVPLTPLANHRSLPKGFLDGRKIRADSKECYGRLAMDGHFRTAVTSVQPGARGSYVLHPTQKRPISVLEAKRSQGFPDDYILWSDKSKPSLQIKDFYRHVGNAVPVPLAAALGRSLETAFVQTWKKLPPRRETSPEI
ncbi:hypothetical protein DFH07DRAFT_972254 [Mycena maculata]|uniref:DNA (cytosine-5-)-methyltransferase n=1 Tax=Mycena maculata TaxID=230809 RepID=A0AAD7HIW7_9AGAR|nr:hypothetical protein DFH07DRAFT_972254 [Mycena maculata]